MTGTFKSTKSPPVSLYVGSEVEVPAVMRTICRKNKKNLIKSFQKWKANLLQWQKLQQLQVLGHLQRKKKRKFHVI